jgi:hypothetical protein
MLQTKSNYNIVELSNTVTMYINVTCASKTGMMSAVLFLRKLRKLGEIVETLKTMGVDSCFSKIT